MPSYPIGPLVLLASVLWAGASAAQSPAPDPAAQPPGGTAGQDATKGQTAVPAQPTQPAAPNLQDVTTFHPFAYGPLQQSGMLAPTKGRVHLLAATPATTQWGWFDNSQPPVLRIRSGDTVVMETMMHSHNQIVPGITIEQV